MTIIKAWEERAVSQRTRVAQGFAMSLVALAESPSTSVCEMWRFLLLKNATEPAAAPRPSSSAIDLSFLWNKPVHVSGQSQCQTALTSGGPTVNEVKSVLTQRCSLVSAGYIHSS